jgi:aspartate/methionine/tyrosine aminotransferase
MFGVLRLTVRRCVIAVYEHLVFEEHEHVSIRSLPGMANRTLRIGSAGKTFSLTAWKVCLCTKRFHR